jgi:lysine-ketoglutarate reductase/saccharopine dehydrogenase-like protein (TIGR00300 family)
MGYNASDIFMYASEARAMSTPSSPYPAVEDVEVRGHIIDSLILPKVLDVITAAGGDFALKDVAIGHGRNDPSFARIEVRAVSDEALEAILAQIADHGAAPVHGGDARLVAADMDGAFPEGFYSTTNQRTEVRVDGHWLPVEDQEMDCGLVIEQPCGRLSPRGKSNSRRELPTCRCLPMTDVKRGMELVVGHVGVRVFPLERQEQGHAFGFMNSAVSTEKPKGVVIREIARQLFANRRGPGKSLLVGGPAIVHTGSGPLVSELIRGGYIHKLFAGNALATHDIEQSLFGTSLGVNLREGTIVDAGHEHHLRAINRIRRAGSIAAAVESGVLASGIMHDCIRHGIEFHLSGSIRDDGPLPDVVTDALECQRIMRAAVHDVTFCLMIATTLHSIAVGNLLRAEVKVVCVDINPSTVIKLHDRGSFQTVGLVTDVEPFLRALVAEVKRLEESARELRE